MVSQSTQSLSARTARKGHHRHVHITGLRDTVDHRRSEPDPKKPFSSKLSEFFPVDDGKAAWQRLAGSSGRHTVQLVPNRIPPQDRRLARSVCLGESKRVREGVEDSSVPLTTSSTPSQPQHYNRKGYQSSCSWYSTHGRPTATLQRQMHLLPAGRPHGAPESPANFVAVSDHVLGNLDAGWRNRNIGWKLDNIHLTSIVYADDVYLLASRS